MNMYIERDLGRGEGHEQSTLNSIMPVKVNDCAQWSEARATSPIKAACQNWQRGGRDALARRESVAGWERWEKDIGEGKEEGGRENKQEGWKRVCSVDVRWRGGEGDRASRRAGEESCDTRSQIDGQIDKTVSVRGARLHWVLPDKSDCKVRQPLPPFLLRLPPPGWSWAR